MLNFHDHEILLSSSTSAMDRPARDGEHQSGPGLVPLIAAEESTVPVHNGPAFAAVTMPLQGELPSAVHQLSLIHI